MTDEIVIHNDEIERAVNGKRVRTSKDELLKALAPMFATFPEIKKMEANTVNAYHMMLCDLDPNKLARAVVLACQAHEYPTHLITPAAIRKAYDGEQIAPGPRSDVDPHTLKPVPTRMFRLDPDEDRRQRMAQLKRTQKWDKLY